MVVQFFCLDCGVLNSSKTTAFVNVPFSPCFVGLFLSGQRCLQMEFQYIEQLCEYSRHGDLKSIQYLLREHKEFDRRRIRKAMVSIYKGRPMPHLTFDLISSALRVLKLAFFHQKMNYLVKLNIE